MRRVRWLWTARVALLGLAAITVVMEYLPHTDDDCAIEVHCLACRWTVGHTATAAPALVLQARCEFVERAPVLVPRATQKGDVLATASRGPPSS
jgi:hypothetical protein